MKNNYVKQGLEIQLLALQDVMDDPLRADVNVCITCFVTEEDCQCLREKVLWPIQYAVKLLQQMVSELR